MPVTVLRSGLIGDHISQARFPAALELMCLAYGLTLEFELIDTQAKDDFDFSGCVDELRFCRVSICFAIWRSAVLKPTLALCPTPMRCCRCFKSSDQQPGGLNENV